jgi:hypothetical protein
MLGGKNDMQRRKHKSTQDFDRENQKQRDHLAGPMCRWENNVNMKLRRRTERKDLNGYFVAQHSNKW